MATDGYIESIHQVANGEIHAPLGDGTCFSRFNILLFSSVLLLIFISLSCLPK